MPRKLTPRGLAALFLLGSALLSVLMLAHRNLFDDELFSLELIAQPVRAIVQVSAEGDVHPPGMYVLAHLAWRAVQSYRWLNLFPLMVLYAGLAAFVLRVTPVIRSMGGRVCFLLLATLHPELLLWSNTFRWYSWWTGVALFTLVLALDPGRTEPRLERWRSAALGVLLACLLYTNYIALLFGLALLVAMWVRYGSASRRVRLEHVAMCAAAFVLLAAPQMVTMVRVHLPHGRGQSSGGAVSTVRLVQALAGSEAYVPWDPLALMAGVVLVFLFGAGLMRLWPRGSCPDDAEGAGELDSGTGAISLFGVCFFVLVALSGLGGKPRSAILLVPVLAPAAASAVERLSCKGRRAALVVLWLWSGVGCANILRRTGLLKSLMNERPGEVARFVTASMKASAGGEGCGVVATYDSGVAFALAEARIPRLVIVSPYRGGVFAGTMSSLPADCRRVQLFEVDSYLGGKPEVASVYTAELHEVRRFIAGDVMVSRFSRDRDAAGKRRLARLFRMGSGADLPEFRFVVWSGAMKDGSLPMMLRQMPYFISVQAPPGSEDGAPDTEP